MTDCDFYQVTTKTLESKEIRPDRQRVSPQVVSMPWCQHPKHSPVDETDATRTIGGGRLLRCGGQLDQCPLSKEQYRDI